MDASRALGPKQRLHRCLGPVVVLLNISIVQKKEKKRTRGSRRVMSRAPSFSPAFPLTYPSLCAWGACGAGGHGCSACAHGIGGCGGCVAVRRVQIESIINTLVNVIIIKRKKKNLHNLVRGVDNDGEDGGDGGDIGDVAGGGVFLAGRLPSMSMSMSLLIVEDVLAQCLHKFQQSHVTLK